MQLLKEDDPSMAEIWMRCQRQIRGKKVTMPTAVVDGVRVPPVKRIRVLEEREIDTATTCAVVLQVPADAVKADFWRVCSSHKDTPGYAITTDYYMVDLTLFKTIFSNWDESPETDATWTATWEQATRGLGRFRTSVRLDFGEDRFHQWCNFQRFDSSSGNGAGILLQSNEVIRFIMHAEASLSVDLRRMLGHQVRCTTKLWIATYTSDGNFCDHAQNYKYFDNYDQRVEAYKRKCHEIFGTPEAPQPMQETAPPVASTVNTVSQDDPVPHFWFY